MSNINNKLLLLNQISNNLPNNILFENLNEQNFGNNIIKDRNQNNMLYQGIYHDNSIHDNCNVNNIINSPNINSNFIKNVEQNMFDDNTYLYKNIFDNQNNNINPLLNPYHIQYNNNFVQPNTNLSCIYDIIRNNNNFVNTNINKPESSIKLNQRLENISLTKTLCNKNGINQIKNLLKNEQYNIDLIRKIILTLNKENGLHIVFKNIYGNYFIQFLFQKMNNDLIQLVIDLISSEFVNIAKSPSGTHCLQELLNYVNNTEKEISIIKAIKYKENEMAFDSYANYVLKKIISVIPDTKRTRLNNIIIENTKELSLNANSVFILKQFIATITIEENKKRIINSLKKNFLIIAENPFGNYVIQYIFEVWPMKDCETIVNEILEKVYDLSCHRFSLNIVIKALNIFNYEYKNKLIYILCFSSNILHLLDNKYGIFVINKAVDSMDNNMKIEFRKFLDNNFKNINSNEQALLNKISALSK